jgi:hypothetical protein
MTSLEHPTTTTRARAPIISIFICRKQLAVDHWSPFMPLSSKNHARVMSNDGEPSQRGACVNGRWRRRDAGNDDALRTGHEKRQSKKEPWKQERAEKSSEASTSKNQGVETNQQNPPAKPTPKK